MLNYQSVKGKKEKWNGGKREYFAIIFKNMAHFLYIAMLMRFFVQILHIMYLRVIIFIIIYFFAKAQILAGYNSSFFKLCQYLT